MSLEFNQLQKKADELAQKLQETREKADAIHKEWVKANHKARDWEPGKPCQARSLVDGWACCLNNDHEEQHQTAGGYKFYQIR